MAEQTIGGDTITYQYDDNGSLIRRAIAGGETYDYIYNLQNRLRQLKVNGAPVVTYTYDPDGIRVQADDGTVATDYLIDPYNHTGYAQTFIEEDGTNQVAYIIGNDVIAQAGPADIQYFLYDGHGSIRQLTDGFGNLISGQVFNYDAYGNIVNSVMPQTNLLYAGEMHDSHLGLYYNRARWYNPTVGRFNRLDPYTGNNFDPQSLHKYAYVHNNPINGIDPSGRLFSTPYHGRRVHDEIGKDFFSKGVIPIYNQSIRTILALKKGTSLWDYDRPDLVEISTTEVYEIKPIGSYILGAGKLGWYLYLLNTNDPLRRVWKPGMTYMPPPAVVIDSYSFAFVKPPLLGVILYEVVDLRPAIGFVTAYATYRIAAEISYRIQLRMALPGLAFP